MGSCGVGGRFGFSIDVDSGFGSSARCIDYLLLVTQDGVAFLVADGPGESGCPFGNNGNRVDGGEGNCPDPPTLKRVFMDSVI